MCAWSLSTGLSHIKSNTGLEIPLIEKDIEHDEKSFAITELRGHTDTVSSRNCYHEFSISLQQTPILLNDQDTWNWVACWLSYHFPQFAWSHYVWLITAMFFVYLLQDWSEVESPNPLLQVNVQGLACLGARRVVNTSDGTWLGAEIAWCSEAQFVVFVIVDDGRVSCLHIDGFWF